MKKIKLLTCIYWLFMANIALGQTSLSAGDIAIIQYNSDNSGGVPEVIKFITFKSLETGTVINFTDHGWKNTGSFRTNEGVVAWTAPREYHCGEIITMNMPTGTDLTTIDSGFALSAAGDQIIAFQGDVSTPTFIFAINNEGTAVWQTTATTSNTSAIPTGLTNGTNAVALTEIDNAKYDGPLSGSKANVLTNICDESNWVGSNTVNQTFSGTFNTTWDGITWDGAGSDFLNATINGTYETSSDGNFTACNCTVNASQTLTVNSGGTVTVENDITNNGSISIESGGSVVQVLSTGTASGSNYTVERTSTSQLEEGNYTYWSSPLASSTLADVADAKKYFSFTASSQSWVAASSGTSMSPGVGYISTGETSITYPSSYTASFSGSAFNTGNINTSVSLGTATFVGADDDWNLLGNPYPSAIDAELFTAANTNLNGTIYYWTHATADSAGDNIQADYAMYNTSGGTGGGSQYIASGQGFFIQANTAGTVTFTNAMRVAGNNSTFYKTSGKRQKVEEKDRIWLSLKSEATKQQILVGFFDEATDDVDRLYDGLKLDAGAETNFYSLINDKPYGIQGKSTLEDIEEISLGFSTTISNYFTLSIDKLEGKLNSFNIYLEDKFLDIKHDLKLSDYTFSSSEAGEFNDRFKLIISSKTLNIETIPDNLSLIIENHTNYITLKTADNLKIKKVLVYSILGEQLLNKNSNSSKVILESSLFKRNSMLIFKTFFKNGTFKINKILKK